MSSLDLKEDSGMDVTPCNPEVIPGQEAKEYDVFLVGQEGDELLYKLRNFLQFHIRNLSTGRLLRVCLEEDFYCQATVRLDLLGLALRHSRYCFMLCSTLSIMADTSQFSESSRRWHHFTRNQTIISHVMNETNVVVVKEKENSIPSSMQNNWVYAGFVDFTLERLFNGNSLRSTNDLTALMGNINQVELSRLQALFRNNTSNSAVSSSNSAPLPPTVRGRAILNEFNTLVNCMDSEHGLLGCLFSRTLLSFPEFDQLKKDLKTQSFIEVNKTIIKKILCLNEQEMDAFIEALSETNQSHIVEYINQKSVNDI